MSRTVRAVVVRRVGRRGIRPWPEETDHDVARSWVYADSPALVYLIGSLRSARGIWSAGAPAPRLARFSPCGL